MVYNHNESGYIKVLAQSDCPYIVWVVQYPLIVLGLLRFLTPMATSKKSSAPKTTNAKNILAEIGALAAPKPAAKSAQKWALPLTDEANAIGHRWAGAKIVSDTAKARLEQAKDAFCEYAVDVLVEKLHETGTRPSNPSVTLTKDGAPDHTFLFLLQDRFSVNLPAVPEGGDAVESAVGVFEGLGLHPEDARNLVENELDFSPVVGIRPLTELLNGSFGENREFIPASPAEVTAGEKLAALLAWTGEGRPQPLTNEEKAIVVSRDNRTAVKAGFFDRVTGYCRSKEQLTAVLKVLKPVAYPSHLKWAPSDSATDQTQRKIAAASELLGG